MYGDAWELSSNAQGGSDSITGGAASANFMYGDAAYMYAATVGGDDTLIGGGSSVNSMVGDAVFLTGNAIGGKDFLAGGANSENHLYGDAGVGMHGNAVGGDDTLIAGDNSTNRMYGDACEMGGAAQGGDDTLISGTSGDDMWGDAEFISDDAQGGNDTFVFRPHSAHDTIYDFEQGKDHIDLSALGLYLPRGNGVGNPVAISHMAPAAIEALKHAPSTETGWDALDSNNNGVLDDGDRYVSVVDGNTDIDLGAAQLGFDGIDLITVAGVTGLVETDLVL